jgi:hypothetical protein
MLAAIWLVPLPDKVMKTLEGSGIEMSDCGVARKTLASAMIRFLGRLPL